MRIGVLFGVVVSVAASTGVARAEGESPATAPVAAAPSPAATETPKSEAKVSEAAPADAKAAEPVAPPAPETRTETVTAVQPAPVAASEGPAAPVAVPVAKAPERAPPPSFTWALHGFVRGGYTLVQPDPDSFAVGQNSGFRLPNTRLNVVGAWGERVKFDLSVDHDQPLDSHSNHAPFRLALRDASVDFVVGAGSYVRVGQFKTPYNGEFLLPDGDVPFTRRSVVSDGLPGDEARMPQGHLGLDRQIGAMFSSEVGPATLQIGAFNGNGQNQGRNDNVLPAVVGRAQLAFGDRSHVALAAYWNDRTVGRLTTRQDERDLSAEIDAMFHAGDLSLFAMAIATRTSFLAVDVAQARLSLGAVLSAAYRFQLDEAVLEPALRGAYYQPTNLVEQVAVIDATAGVNFIPWKSVPVRFQLNAVKRIERESRAAPNDVIEAIAQANF